MSTLTGMGGSMLVGESEGEPICLKSWSLTHDLGVLDVTTTCAENWHVRMTGVQSMSVSVEGFYDPTLLDITLLDVATVLFISFQIGLSVSSYSGTWLCENFKVDNNATEAVTFSATFTSTGPITIAE